VKPSAEDLRKLCDIPSGNVLDTIMINLPAGLTAGEGPTRIAARRQEIGEGHLKVQKGRADLDVIGSSTSLKMSILVANPPIGTAAKDPRWPIFRTSFLWAFSPLYPCHLV
jgi:hypothetical protein